VTLAELQALLHGRITRMVPGREDELRLQVLGRPPLEALERVEIYSGMYLHRLVDAIAEDVPHTSRVLGTMPSSSSSAPTYTSTPAARRTSDRPAAPSGRGSGRTGASGRTCRTWRCSSGPGPRSAPPPMRRSPAPRSFSR
jgi:hypothetical protein